MWPSSKEEEFPEVLYVNTINKKGEKVLIPYSELRLPGYIIRLFWITGHRDQRDILRIQVWDAIKEIADKKG